MDDAVHVEIQVVKLLEVGIWLGAVDWSASAVFETTTIFVSVDNGGRVLLGEPSEECGYSHSELDRLFVAEDVLGE